MTDAYSDPQAGGAALDWQSTPLPQGTSRRGTIAEAGVTFQVWLPPVSAPIETTDKQHSHLSDDLMVLCFDKHPRLGDQMTVPQEKSQNGAVSKPQMTAVSFALALLLTRSPWQPFGEGGRRRKGDPPGRV